MLNHFRSIHLSEHLSEEENDVSGRRQLAFLGAVLTGVRPDPVFSKALTDRPPIRLE
jgi:hypothetical protein